MVSEQSTLKERVRTAEGDAAIRPLSLEPTSTRRNGGGDGGDVDEATAASTATAHAGGRASADGRKGQMEEPPSRTRSKETQEPCVGFGKVLLK